MTSPCIPHGDSLNILVSFCIMFSGSEVTSTRHDGLFTQLLSCLIYAENIQRVIFGGD